MRKIQDFFQRFRSGSTSSRRCRTKRLGFEPLEGRNLLAGNVIAAFSGGNLRVKGDALDNEIRIGITAGDLVVEGLNGTTINRQTAPFVAVAGGDTIPRSLVVSLKQGNDSLLVEDIKVTSRATIWGNRGSDLIEVRGDSEFGNNLTIIGGATADVIFVHDITTPIEGKVTIRGKKDTDTIGLENNVFNAPVNVSGNASNDSIAAFNNTFNDTYRADGGGRIDRYGEDAGGNIFNDNRRVIRFEEVDGTLAPPIQDFLPELPPAVSVDVAPLGVDEDGATNLDYTFTRVGDTTGSLTVDFSVGGTATFDVDYTQTGADTFTTTMGSVSFAPGSATAVVTIDPTDDTMTEADETVILTVVSGVAYSATTPSSATGTIINDDIAEISIVKTGAFNDESGDGFADVGETISYTFDVANTGVVTLTNVMVTDPLVTVLGGPATLDMGETNTTTFMATYVITQADIDAGQVDNTATADSDESEPASDDETVVLPQNPLLSIVKTGTFNDEGGDGFADVGETIGYTFDVANEGDVTLTNVTITDPLVTVLGGPTTLDVGETDTTTFTGTYVITQADIDAGQVDNTATADSDESDPASDDETVVLPQNPLLSIVKTGTFNDEGGDGFPDVGETIGYTFDVANEGDVTLTNVTVTDPLVTVLGGPTTLDVGETDTTTFTATYVITQADIDAGQVDNTATADSDESDPASDDETVVLQQNLQLSIVKTGTFNDEGDDGFADVGETISYTFDVANDGNLALTNVTVTDPLVTVLGGPTTLDVGETDTTTFTATYVITQADIDAGQVDNTATAESDESDPASDDATTLLPQNPLLSIVKTGTFNDEGADGFADVGETIGYTFDVANDGNLTLTNVTVTDPLVTVLGGPTTLDVDETDTTTFTATYVITQADIDAGQVDNTAMADSDESDPASDDETILLPQNPLLSIVKTGTFNDEGADGFADVGETIGYTFDVANDGNLTLTNVTVSDPLVTVLGGPTTLDVDETDTTTFTATYVITQADIDAGQVDNTATADSDESDPASDDETILLPQNPLLSIVKTGTFNDEGGDGLADVGETISYTFDVANDGNLTLTNVTVTDPLVTVLGGPTTLDVGETDTTTFTATYVITQADIDAGQVDNTATADSDESDPESDDETVILPLP